MDLCFMCAKFQLVSRDDEKIKVCEGCAKPPDLCLCTPVPNLTVAYDLFVDHAWLEPDPKATIHGLPQLAYTVGALCEEAGEAFGKVKKMYRDDRGQLTEERKLAILNELGDAVFYVAKAAHLLGMNLSSVLDMSTEKNLGRIARKTQHGDGDDR